MSENEEKRVLALKYRPKRFEDLVGQNTVSQTLSLALKSNRLSHAYLFSGLRGSGKTSTARIMAKALLCSNGPTANPCETCENCVSANTNRHLDIIEMDAASNRGIDDIKDLIEHTKYKPSSARFKVFIIDEVHMLTTQAFNALLKTLEEPPGFVKFILATTDPLKLPATILSRTQHFRFKKISQKDVVHHLSHILNEEGIDFENEALEIIARSGQGSLRDTLTLLDQAIIFSKAKLTTSSVVDMLGLIDPEFLDKIFDVIIKGGDINPIIESLEEYEASSVCDEITIYLKNKMLYSKDARFNILLYDRFFRIIGDAKHLLAINSDPTFVLILMFSKMLEATNLKTVDELIDEVQSMEISEQVKPIESKMTNAISTNTVVEHAKEEYIQNHPPQANLENTEKTEKTEKLEEVQKVEEVSQTKVPNDLTPFDKVENVVENINEPIEEEPKLQNYIDESEAIQTVQVEASEPEVVKPQETIQTQEQMQYKTLTEKLYDRNYDLGLCFEKNFIFDKFENNTLYIISYAQDDDRKFLYKHFGIIKTFARDVFGLSIEFDFAKGEVSKKPEEVVNKVQPQETNVQNDEVSNEANNTSSSMMEDIEMGGGCVANMGSSNKPNLSQKELQMEDILNSPMLNKAKELFDIKKITVKTKT